MSEGTAEAGNASTSEANEGGNNNGNTSTAFTQADVDRIVADRLTRERSKFGDYDQLREKASQLEGVAGERDTLKSQAETATSENLRLRVALEKRLPVELVDRLRGATKQELEADADELMKLVKPSGSGFDGGTRESTTTKTDINSMIRRAAGRE